MDATENVRKWSSTLSVFVRMRKHAEFGPKKEIKQAQLRYMHFYKHMTQ